LKNFLAEQKKFVEHLDKIIQDYKRIYQDMSPYFSSDLYTTVIM